MYELQEKKISKPEEIECKYFMPDRKALDNMDVLILSVNGSYPHGSSGNLHAEYISVMAVQGLQAFEPEAFILDIRELEYHWGSAMLGVFQNISKLMDSYREDHELFFPVFAVISEKSNGLLSLATSNHGAAWIFEDINEAIEKAAIAAKEWLDD